MWRAFGQKGAAGAAAGLASLPAVAECRAPSTSQQSAGTLRKGPLKVSDPSELASLESSHSQQASESWLAPDFKDGEYLGLDEVQDALSDVLSVASGRSRPAAFAPLSDDCSSVESFGADADGHIEASDGGTPPEQLSSVMHRLLNNADVQRAVMGALRDSPELESLLDSPELEHIQPLCAANLLLPATAAVALEHRPPAERNALEKGLDSLGAAVENGIEFAAGTLAALGANIAGVSDGLGRILSRLASDACAALRGSDAEAEVEASNRDAAGGGGRKRTARRSLLAGSLFTLAVAVVAMLVFKRAKIVRIVRV